MPEPAPCSGKDEDGGSTMEDGKRPANPSSIFASRRSGVDVPGVLRVMTQLALMRKLIVLMDQILKHSDFEPAN